MRTTALIFLSLSLATFALADDFNYIDPSQLDCPWPKHSFYKQPWRGYLEVKPAVDFLAGIGVNYHVAGNDELAVRLLAESGFRAFRIEIGWGSVSFDEKTINGSDRFRRVLSLCKRYNIRPTMLLNAHQGAPCPVTFFQKRLVADAPKGARTVQLADIDGLVPGYSGINGLSDYWAAEAIVTAIDPNTGECQLSKPLPKALPAGNIAMATLKYLPLYPAGSKSFEDTANGFVQYALMICKLVSDAGIEDFDIEIWNELTFGTKFLDINNYYQPKLLTDKAPDFLHPGGNCWELARQTINAVKSKYPKVRCIWGFSNTTFYHCPIEKLPPGMDGQSYHPYGTGLRRLPDQETHKYRPELNLDGYTPRLEIRMPEGWAHTFIQTECLIRHLNPEARKEHPQNTTRFYHYVTEHGVVPSECGITTEAGAWDLKTKCALRSFCLWLNKGLDVMHYFKAHGEKSDDMGILPLELKRLPADAVFDDVATPPMRALRNLTRAFVGSAPITRPIHLQVDVAPVGKIGNIFDGDATHPPLTHRDVFAFLPFQATDTKLVVAIYVMTYDTAKPMPDETYRLTLRGLPASVKGVRLYDPVSDKTIGLKIIESAGAMRLDVPATDTPRLLIIDM